MTEGKQRVLMLGTSGFPFVDGLADHLRQGLDISVSTMGFSWNGLEEGFQRPWIFDEILTAPGCSRDALGILCDILYMISHSPLSAYADAFGGLVAGRWRPADGVEPQTFLQALVEKAAWLIRRARLNQLRSTIRPFDVYHIQSLLQVSWEKLEMIPPHCPVIVTVWGSDLLRLYGTENYGNQCRLLERADRITVSSVEIREVLLAKFGRHLGPKIRFAHFGNQIFSRIRDTGPQAVSDFRSRREICDRSTVVCLGNNGTPENQHRELIDAIASLPEAYRENIYMVIPMTYGGCDDYIEEVRDCAKESGIPFILIEEFLGPKEMACLRLCSDIILFCPESDLLSASLCEAMYAGSVVITGSWLPYSTLRSISRAWHEVDNVSEVTAVAKGVLANFTQERNFAAIARDDVGKVLGWPNAINSWLDVYAEVMPEWTHSATGTENARV